MTGNLAANHLAKDADLVIGIGTRYSDFTIAVNREGSKGITGRGGVMGGLARRVVAFAANWQRLHAGNPGDPRNNPRRGQILHAFSTKEALPDYIWYGIRDGMMAAMRR